MSPARVVHRTARAGFSLVEILAVLALLGILAGLAAPSLTGWINRSRLDAAIGQLSGDLAHVRMLAVRSGQGAVLTINAGGTSYTFSVPGGGTVTKDLAQEYPGLRLVPDAGMSFPLVLQFDSRGMLRDPAFAGRITAQQHSRTASLRILGSGRAVIED